MARLTDKINAHPAEAMQTVADTLAEFTEAGLS